MLDHLRRSARSTAAKSPARSQRPILVPALVAICTLLAACGGDDSSDERVDGTTSTAAPTANADEVDPAPSGLAAAIAGDVSWEWQSFRERGSVAADAPELPRMQHVFVVDDEVWAEGRTDPPIGEESVPVTAVIDPETREFELFDTPGFGQATVHDELMWGFDEDSRSIVTFDPDSGTSDPVVVPEAAAVLDATTASGPTVRFVSLTDDRLFLQVESTMLELDTDDPGAVVTSFDAAQLFSEVDASEPFHAYAAGEAILYHFYGEHSAFAATPPDGAPVAIEDADPQSEVVSTADTLAWHEGSDLLIHDVAAGTTETIALSGAPTQVPSNALHWDAGAVRHIGDDGNPALHIGGSPSEIIVATAKEDEVVLVDASSGAKAAVGHLYGDVTDSRPQVVGDEVWLWSHDGQGIAILTFGPPVDEGDEDGGDEKGSDSATQESSTDDPEYRSGSQQGRWAAEADLEGGWPADNDPDNYDPNASAEFKAGYVAGYDETYADGETVGDDGSGTDDGSGSDDECPPGRSLEECYG